MNDIEAARKKRERESALTKNEVPAGCSGTTFICPECSGVMQLIFDEEHKLLKIVNLRHRADEV